MYRGIFGPNGTIMQTPRSIQQRTTNLLPAYATLNKQLMREFGAASNGYSTGVAGLGASPPGLGFNFGQSWSRTQQGVMEFSNPVGQIANMEMAMRFALENAFIGKAMRVRTQLTCRGFSNNTPNLKANDFLDSVVQQLELRSTYRLAVWLYNVVGLAPILLPEKDEPLNWVQILDPRMVRIMKAYGKTYMYMVMDSQMLRAFGDQKGTSDPRNKDYWDALPKSWKKQIADKHRAGQLSSTGENLIRLEEGSYLCLDNRYNAIDRKPNNFDGIPLQPYFEAAQLYRMLMAGDFASAFLAKNLIALVSVGDPNAEGDMYVRPDDTVNYGLRTLFQNPNSMQWIFGDPTMNVRYITPSADAFGGPKFSEPREHLKNLLPSPFWFNDGGGSFAAATVEMKVLMQDIDSCNEDFDNRFWTPLYERACDGRAIAKKYRTAPTHDRDALKDEAADLASKSTLYNNGGLDIYSLMEAHGFNPQVVRERLAQQQKDAKSGLFLPAFEQKQGIVAAKVYGLNKPTPAPGGGGSGASKPSGGQTKTSSNKRPQSESQTGRTPRRSK